MTLRYDHPNAVVRRENHVAIAAGTTAASITAFFQKALVKAVHVFPVVAGTATAQTFTVRSIAGTTTTSIGIGTLGTQAVGGGGVKIALGTGNNPTGVSLSPGDQITVIRAADATGVAAAMVEWQALPDTVLT